MLQIFTQDHRVILRSHCGITEPHCQDLTHQSIHPVQVPTDPVHRDEIRLHSCNRVSKFVEHLQFNNGVSYFLLIALIMYFEIGAD